MINDFSQSSYYVVAIFGVVLLLQGILTKGKRSSYGEQDASNPLLTWPGRFQRVFFLCVGFATFAYAIWKLFDRE
jgi:hypothetical protein